MLAILQRTIEVAIAFFFFPVTMSDSLHTNPKHNTAEKDEADLARMGYKQELK
jgi:hypothetical protein